MNCISTIFTFSIICFLICFIFAPQVANLIIGNIENGNTIEAELNKHLSELLQEEIQVIGATTMTEYRKYIEKDAALERRFQPVQVDEPAANECIEMIRGLKSSYEKYHGVEIPDEMIELSVNMAIRYVSDRFLPDKAIDVIDEACACAKIRSKSGIRRTDSEYMELRGKNYTIDGLTRLMGGDGEAVVSADDVMSVVSMKTGIPLNKITAEEGVQLGFLEKTLSERVVGHGYAVKKVTNAVCRSKSGLGEGGKPAASFLFAGPSGVGKTELARALADCLFSSEKNLIRIDMSEYMEKHSVSKLIGAPPGYAGYDEKTGSLCDRIRRNPYSLVLFDEIEKADPDVLNIMLQILDYGTLTDSTMRKVSFANCMIIMTSNVGAEMAGKSGLGFGIDGGESENRVLEAVKARFTPEFTGRIDEIIVFRSLEREDLMKISEKALDNLRVRAEALGIGISYGRDIVEAVAAAKETDKYGARCIKRRVTDLIENELAKMIIGSSICKGETVKIESDNGKIRFSKSVVV